MNTTKSTQEMPLECARLGTKDDEAFLQRIDRALSAATSIPSPQRKSRYATIGSLAAAAAIVVIGGAMLMNRSPEDKTYANTPENWVIAGGIEVQTDLPPEMLEGTPKQISVPGLLPKPNIPATLMVPEGTRLLSRGKPATSSDDNPIIGSIDTITDGNKEAGEGYFVELLDGLQWVQIDLEQHADIQAVWVWHYHMEILRAYHDVIVQVSDDPEFKQGVTTVYNNDYDNSAGMGKGADRPYLDTRYGLLVNANATPGRYIRLYSQGNTSNEMNHYIEVEVFGNTR